MDLVHASARPRHAAREQPAASARPVAPALGAPLRLASQALPNELGSSRIASAAPPEAGPARARDRRRTSSGATAVPSSKIGATDARCGDDDRPPLERAPHRRERRQRHHGVAEPVRRADQQSLHLTMTSSAPRGRASQARRCDLCVVLCGSAAGNIPLHAGRRSADPASGGASTARDRDSGARTSRGRRCSAA